MMPWRRSTPASPSAPSPDGSAPDRSGCSSSSTSSSSPTSRRGASGGLDPEELDILFLPGDPDPVALAPSQRRVVVACDLCEQPLTTGREMELDEIAEVLDEDDLAGQPVQAGGPSATVTLERHGGR